MIKFIMKNKLQFMFSFLTNLVMFIFLLFIIVVRLYDYIGIMSIFSGLFLTGFFVANIKKYNKLIRLRVTVIYVLAIVLLHYSTKFILDPSDVLSGLGIFTGFLLYIVTWNIADTVHNIREKSKLSLQDLEVK